MVVFRGWEGGCEKETEIFLSSSRQWGKKLGKKKQGTASTHLSGLDHNLLLLDVNSLRLDGRRLLEEVMVVFRGWEGGCEKETEIFLSSSRQWGKKLGKKKQGTASTHLSGLDHNLLLLDVNSLGLLAEKEYFVVGGGGKGE